jgi:hypothetical protein
MLKKRMYQSRVEVLQGTLDMLILKTLQWGPQHGYGIIQALRANSGEMLQIETGSLYPASRAVNRFPNIGDGGEPTARTVTYDFAIKFRNAAAVVIADNLAIEFADAPAVRIANILSIYLSNFAP